MQEPVSRWLGMLIGAILTVLVGLVFSGTVIAWLGSVTTFYFSARRAGLPASLFLLS